MLKIPSNTIMSLAAKHRIPARQEPGTEGIIFDETEIYAWHWFTGDLDCSRMKSKEYLLTSGKRTIKAWLYFLKKRLSPVVINMSRHPGRQAFAR
jgi:hypothetical protein